MFVRTWEIISIFFTGITLGIGGALISAPAPDQKVTVSNTECSFNSALNASWAIEERQAELDMQRIKYLGGPDNFLKWLNMRNERAAIEGAKE